jgi:hypothetical protein
MMNPPVPFPLLEDENGFNDSYFRKIASAAGPWTTFQLKFDR